MDVKRRAGKCARVAEGFHAIDDAADAVSLVADELREVTLARGHRFFEQLRGTANSRQRIFDFMRQHRRHAMQRAHGATMQKLAVDALCETALLKRDEHSAVRLGNRRHDHVRDALAMLGRGEVHVALADARVALARLIHQLDDRARKRHDVG